MSNSERFLLLFHTRAARESRGGTTERDNLMSWWKAVDHYRCRKERLFEATEGRSCNIIKKRRWKAVWRGAKKI